MTDQDPSITPIDLGPIQHEKHDSPEGVLLARAAGIIREMLHDYRRLGYGAQYWQIKYNDLAVKCRCLGIEVPYEKEGTP